MPILSHLHDLCRAEDCQADSHTLRWSERPLQCPRCDSHHVSAWGTDHDRPGCTRDRDHGCERTFNDRTHTRMYQRQRLLPHGMLASVRLGLPCSSRRMAREVGA
jgi:transposase-like protein